MNKTNNSATEHCKSIINNWSELHWRNVLMWFKDPVSNLLNPHALFEIPFIKVLSLVRYWIQFLFHYILYVQTHIYMYLQIKMNISIVCKLPFIISLFIIDIILFILCLSVYLKTVLSIPTYYMYREPYTIFYIIII